MSPALPARARAGVRTQRRAAPRRMPQRRGPLLRRPPTPRRKKRWWFLALLALCLFWLWPRTPPARLPAPSPAAAAAPRLLPHDPRATQPPALALVTPPVLIAKKPAAGPASKLKKIATAPLKPAEGISRDLLLAAVQARSPALRACALPPGSPARVSARLRIARAGDLRTVQFVNAEPLPHALAECLRTTMQRWSFKDLPLKSDIELLVDFLLAA